LTVNRRDIDVPPQDFKNMTTATKLALWTAKQAIADAGILQSDIDRQKIGVIMSQNATEMTPISGDLAVRDAIPDILAAIRRVMDVSPEQAVALAEEIAAGRSIQDDTSLLGRLSSMVPGFICNKFGFTGPSYSVLAACASSLVALHSAVQLMRNGILDAALVGGAEEPLSALHFLEFSVLGALAGITGQVRPPVEMSRPFDRDRDGFVMGEGAGMIMLERESVARRRGARIYGFITGVGASNTETGMVESSRHSQIRAIKASFGGLNYGPEAVDLVECHATATRQGDLEEVHALQELYPANKQTVLAGFKSQIGHTLGAAGINSLIRGVMAMNAGIFPATLNCVCPDPGFNWHASGFAVLDKPAPWRTLAGRPRRLQVDAFGFGGSNFVVQLEQAGEGANQAEEFSAAPSACLPGIQTFSRSVEGKKYNLAILADSPVAAEELIEQSDALRNVAALTEKRRRSLARQGVHVSRPDALPSRVALIFPGQGSQYVGMGKQLGDQLPELRHTLLQAGEHFGFDICQLLFESSEDKLRDTRWQQPAIFALEVAIAQVLLSCGLQPVALAGHSLGQYAALCVANVFSFADGCKIVNQRALCMEKAGHLSADPGAMLAVHAAREVVEPLLSSATGVFLLNSNSPLQTVVGGDTAATLALAETLSEQGIRSTRLPVAMAFHSPMFQTVAAEFADFLQTIPFLPPTIPVLSNHTGEIFPTEAGEIRRLLAEHLYSPVDWLQNVSALRADYAVDLFVEAGPRETLGNMIRDSFQQADCLPTCLPSIEFSVLQHAIAQLFTAGCLPHMHSQQEIWQQPMPTQSIESAAVQERAVALSPVNASESDFPVSTETLAAVIDVIVQTTGYEPDEVAADMDLRDDLAIRSSRLPVIADALETRFGISLDLQDFAGVRTVRDIAGRIELIRQRRSGSPAKRSGPVAEQQAAPEMVTGSVSPRRIVFSQEPLTENPPDYLQFSPLDKIGIACSPDDWTVASSAAAVLKRDYGVTLVQVDSPEQAGAGLAGLLLWFGDWTEQNRDAAAQLIENFLLIQAFVMQPTARAVLVLDQSSETITERPILAAGVEGILLSLAWEYRSLLFRSLHFVAGAALDQLIRRGLDQNLKPMILFGGQAGIFGEVGQETPLVMSPGATWQLGPQDVVVVSGGGAGILQEWVRALIPFGCRIVLLGRTKLASAEQTRSTEIRALLEELAAAGVEAGYLECDVADAAQTETAMATAAEKFGRISGVIHGAGILRDHFLPQITVTDFSAVLQVKLQGAQNLFAAAQVRGLRFFTAISSVAAVNGNAGQVVYAAANRAMTAYLKLMQRQYPQIRCQALLLGPVEGGGMADTEEIRALMRWSGYSYIHAREVAQLFCREMAGTGQKPAPVLLVKEMPLVSAAPVEQKMASTDFAGSYPMLDELTLDLRTPSLSATRCFEAARDLWLPEHRPLIMLKQPLVSGIMMVEMFAEAARALYPYLSLQSIRNVKFLDRIECPADQPRHSRIQCQRAETKAGSLRCPTELHTQELSPTGRKLDRWSLNAKATVVLGSTLDLAPIEEFSLPAATLAAQSVVDRTGLLNLYEQYTGLTGRYRVLQRIGSFAGGIAEAAVALQNEADFAARPNNDYQTSPYLLESIFQTIVFQTLLEQQGQAATIALPYAVSEIHYYRQGASQGNFKVQARRRSADPTGAVWDAIVVNDVMKPVVAARGVEMRWLSL
jgi:acyl transferase domain-containing protein/NAD(P)-dependent dehydrogenase (short-subunit alcohol dehydrogenase family)